MAQVFRGVSQVPAALGPTVVTIGNFDGAHRGHQAILRAARAKAQALGVSCAVFTFRPHPQHVLRPASAPPLLLTYDEKLAALSAFGADLIVEEPFSREFSLKSAEDFFENTLKRVLKARAVVVGYDFAFGRERQGSLDRLREWCRQAGIEVEVVAPIEIDQRAVSSSRIRSLYLSGDIEAANALMGRPFGYQGPVVHGDARGRQLGFPTANVKPQDLKLTLPFGVYATWVWVDGQEYPGATNFGIRPMFETAVPLIEAHLLGFSGDLYGKNLDIRFVKRLREEQKFETVEALKAQIVRDCAEAATVLRNSQTFGA